MYIYIYFIYVNTFSKTNIAPENEVLNYDRFLFELTYLQGKTRCSFYRGCTGTLVTSKDLSDAWAEAWDDGG